MRKKSDIEGEVIEHRNMEGYVKEEMALVGQQQQQMRGLL